MVADTTVNALMGMKGMDLNALVSIVSGGKILIINSTDIDECKKYAGICGNGSECQNNAGNYSCLCTDGYHLQDRVCTGK